MIRLFHMLLIGVILLCPLTCPLAAAGTGVESANPAPASCCPHCADRTSGNGPDVPHPENQVCQCFCSQAYTVQTVEQQSLEAELGSHSPLLDAAGIPSENTPADATSLHFVWESPPLSTRDGRAMRLWICSLTC